jgi:hypothetical protein
MIFKQPKLVHVDKKSKLILFDTIEDIKHSGRLFKEVHQVDYNGSVYLFQLQFIDVEAKEHAWLVEPSFYIEKTIGGINVVELKYA